ncbi:MAG: EamA family transporter [Firmicutes bacterium]|nr:EamA family transporter [Bacillota bacterium]
MWLFFAALSSVFAAFTSIFAKIGIEGVNSNLATAIRTVVVLVMAWGMVFITGAQSGMADISRRSWLFLIVSGMMTGASWLCYYKAVQMGDVSKIVPIDKLSGVLTIILAFAFLHEELTVKSIVGCILIAAGTLCMVL